MSKSPAAHAADTFHTGDIVALSDGRGPRLIVTGYHPNRPANCWSGVKEKGQGKEYVFGSKHRPVKVGEADETHPALVAYRNRRQGASDRSEDYQALVRRLVEAVRDDQFGRAKLLAEALHELN